MDKRTTRERVREFMKTNPKPNLSDLARKLGVSRERIRQLAVAEGLWEGGAGPLYRPRGSSVCTPVPRMITGGVPVRLSASAVGTVSELLVAADLSARGFWVFFPFVRSALCDLVAMRRNGKTIRIEVRSGHRTPCRKKIVYSQNTDSPAEHHAIVITGEPVEYQPPLRKA